MCSFITEEVTEFFYGSNFIILTDLSNDSFWLFKENVSPQVLALHAKLLHLNQEEWLACRLIDMPLDQNFMPFFICV